MGDGIAMGDGISYAAATTLKEAGFARGIFMGSQHKTDLLANSSDPTYARMLWEQYSITTAGNACKWGKIQRTRGVFVYDDCETSLQAAEKHNVSFRGHNLCWGNNNPQWLLDGNFNSSELAAILQNYITTVVSNFGDRMYAWDVVNEALNNTGFKPAVPWYPTLPNYVDLAFQYARAADPSGKIKLFYNDFSIDRINAKSDVVYAMVKSMKARDIPIDGVGLQMHISSANPPPRKSVQSNIERLVALGVEVHITELDVKCFDCNGTAGLQRQATVYADMLRACLAVKGCTSFETWGFTDRYSWLNGDRCHDENCYPLPYDKDYKAKPAVKAMLDVLHN